MDRTHCFICGKDSELYTCLGCEEAVCLDCIDDLDLEFCSCCVVAAG